MKHAIIPAATQLTAIDRNDPEKARTAIMLEWPETFSDRAKMVIRYFDDTIYLFSYDGKLVATDESRELTEYGNGTSDSPFGFYRWEGTEMEHLEAWLEAVADDFDAEKESVPGWAEAKDAFMTEQRITAELAHIEKLRVHGAKVIIDGKASEVNSYLWDTLKDECWLKGYEAIACELVIPETDEPLLLAIHRDGHVDSGSRDNVMRCMAVV